LLPAAIFVATQISAGASAQTSSGLEILSNGKLRVASFTNNILFMEMPDGRIVGAAADLGNFVARKLGVTFEPIVYRNPESYMSSFGTGAWDIAIGPRTAATAEKSELGPDFVLVDNIYLAAPGREFADANQVDRPGVRIGVAQNGPVELLLTRTLRSAELVRVPGGVPDTIELLRSGKADVFASNGEVIHAAANSLSGSKIVPGAFNTVRMAVTLPKGRSAAAQAMLTAIVNEAKVNGIARKAIEQYQLKGVRAAQE
jgi:polar amino acid transport system substrate-binding protein